MPRLLIVPITSARGFLGQPIVLTRGAVLSVALVLGLLAAGGVILGAVAVNNVANERSDRSAQARAQLKRELDAKVARAQQEARLARLEQPTQADLERAVNRALRLLRTRPALAARVQTALQAATSRPSASVPSGGLSSDTRPSRGGSPSTTGRSPGTPAAGGGPSSASPPGGSSGSGSGSPSAPPAGRPRPPVDVGTPPSLPLPAPSICTPILAVNCP